jgi:glycosyltransferase involved in cell wall biosynthesis
VKTHAVSVLFVANYPTNTGYAWDHIERLFARVADRLEDFGVRTFVAFPAIPEPPRALDGSHATPVTLDASLDRQASTRDTIRFIRNHDVKAVYFTDRPLWRFEYVWLRLAGVQRVIVHDRTSGARVVPRGIKRVAKWVLGRISGFNANTVVAVSEFVRRRDLEVWQIPPERIVTIYNGFPVGPNRSPDRRQTHHELGIAEERPIIACACRAAMHKGVDYLFRAFDRLMGSHALDNRPVLVYLGDGPYMNTLIRIHSELSCRRDILLGGYRPRAVELLKDADLFVVPSIWEDAFPSAVLEPMSRGIPVIASDVGGIPEMIEDGVSGLLVPPADEENLATALEQLLSDPEHRLRIGAAARRRVAQSFPPERQVERIINLLLVAVGRLPP